MCGRFTLRSSMPAVAAEFDVDVPETALLLFNIAPTQQVSAVRVVEDDRRALCSLRWGLVPQWADDLAVGNRMINARADSVATKPAFRQAFASRRCLVVADGFYEWQRGGRQKQPYYFRLRDDRPFGFAGLWERWSKGGQTVESCTIITTEPNELVAPLHDRMPVILPHDAYDLWLSPRTQEIELLQSLLQPYASDQMVGYPVSTRVNRSAYNEPDCIRPQTDEKVSPPVGRERTLFD
ncbi:MAG TPA: SOS response-associated peptidase [Pirellulales bacterium]|nr:SOS response-associated peptidase [Pirellulales bacterium]